MAGFAGFRNQAFEVGKQVGQRVNDWAYSMTPTTTEDEEGNTYKTTPQYKFASRVGMAREHSGAAYGVRTTGSELAPNVPMYGKGDMRGKGLVTKKQPKVEMFPAKVAGLKNPTPLELGGDTGNMTGRAVTKKYYENPPGAFFEPGRTDPGGPPLFPDEEGKPMWSVPDSESTIPSDWPPRGLGNGPKKTRRT